MYSSIRPVELNSLGLLALILPDSIEQPLLALQTALYRERGVTSAMALPPLIPVLWTSRPLPLESVRRIAVTHPSRLRLQERTPVVCGSAVLIAAALRAAEEGGDERRKEIADAARREVAAAGVEEREGLFDAPGGVYLAAWEPGRTADESEAFPALDHLPEESGALTLTSYLLEFSPSRNWWSSLRYAAAARRRLAATRR